MRLVDDYGADDDRVDGRQQHLGLQLPSGRRAATNWSQHAYGAAIDINPVQNPYVRGRRVDPPAGRPFAAIDRSRVGARPAGRDPHRGPAW